MLVKRNGLLDKLFAYLEKRRLSRSHKAPFFAGAGRGLYRYYEAGRSVNIDSELMLGPTRIVIYPQTLKWIDTGEVLSAEKQTEVISLLCRDLDRQKVTWEFYRSR